MNPHDRNRSPAPAPPARPNVVLMLVDDMGFSDIGCFGSEIRTPNLDRLASRGVRFTQMYNCARCCPSRASLLTGLYPHQAGVGFMANDRGVGPAYQGRLRDDCVTIAEMLGDCGYRTIMSGKWHVGRAFMPNRPETFINGVPGYPTPRHRGFEEYWGMLGGGSGYYKPAYMAHNDVAIRPGGGDFFLTDAFADEAVRMIEQVAGGEDPFFLYFAPNAPHWPLHALPEDIARYESVYLKGGWDAFRTARHEQLKGLGILDPSWGISPRDAQAPPWSDLEPARRDWEDLRMAVYAAQVDRMDQAVGKVVAKLEQLGVADDTLILFLSDNGGAAEFLAEDTRTPNPANYKGYTFDGRPVKVGNAVGLRPGPDDTYMSYDLPWANVSNAPFRRYKHWVHEGGISTPLVAHWPRGLGVEPRLCHSPAHMIDILPTIMEATDATYPSEHDGQTIQPLEGESLLPAMKGRTWRRQRPIFWEHEGNRAVRIDNWKLVSKFPGPWELYDMNVDRTELSDLSESKPGRVEGFERLYDEWAQRCGVLPWEQIVATFKRRRG